MKDFARHGWKEVSLGEICEKTETVDPRKAPGEEFDYVDVSSVSNETFTIEETQRLLGADAPSRARRKIRSGDILFATIRPTLQRIAQVPAHLNGQVCSTGYIVLRPKPALDARFLMHSLFRPDFTDSMETLQSGASYPAVTDKQVRAQKIPLPPLEEQQRIVAVLDEAFEGLAHARAHAEANLQNARDLLAVSLDEIFGSDNPTWKTAGLSELCVIGDGNHSSKYPKKSEMVPEGVPFLRSGNIQNGEIDRSEMLYISEAKHAELKKGHLESGDVLFTNRGEIGKVAIVPEDLESSNLNSQVAWLRCQGDLDNRFLFFFLQSGRMKQHYSDTQSGAALQQFTIKMLKAVTVRFPSLPEQKAAVKRMETIKDEIFRLVSAYQATATDLDDLRQSLLQKAFAGELTREEAA